MRTATLLALLAVLVAASPAAAFDGERRGFVLGLGAGYGYAGVDDGRSGLSTRLDIGVGLTDRTLVHYAGKQILHSRDGVLFTQAFPLLGVTHFLAEQAPGAYVSGGVGGSLLLEMDHGHVGGAEGLTVFGGGGWEWARHWTVGVDVAHTRADFGGVTSVLVGVGYLAY